MALFTKTKPAPTIEAWPVHKIVSSRGETLLAYVARDPRELATAQNYGAAHRNAGAALFSISEQEGAKQISEITPKDERVMVMYAQAGG